MPTSLQYPLERQRDLQRRWSRLLQRTAEGRRCGSVSPLAPDPTAVLVDTVPPRDPDDDDDDEEDDEEESEDREPAVIREPDKDE
jgi:hypothetical protein